VERLGITTAGGGTTELSDSMRIDLPVSPLAANVLQYQVDNIYQKFIELVADARNTTPELIDDIAQGRVWSGSSALNLGLVDQLGYLDDAIDSAAQIANLDDYKVELIEPKLTPFQQFTQNLTANATALAIDAGLFSSVNNDGLQLLMQSQQWRMTAGIVKLIKTRAGSMDVFAHCTQCVVQ